MFADIVILLLCYIAVKVWQIDKRLSQKDPHVAWEQLLGWIELLAIPTIFLGLIWYGLRHW